MLNFYHDYPRADLHEMNLDWIISQMKALIKELEDVKKNGLKPIEGEITEIDNSITIINNEIQNLYNLFGFFIDPVTVRTMNLIVTDDNNNIQEVDIT